MHLEQLVQRGAIIEISASLSSMASSGHTPTQQPQKSHLSGKMAIINLPFFAVMKRGSILLVKFYSELLKCNHKNINKNIQA